MQDTRGCEWFTYYSDTKLCASLSVCLRLNNTHCGDNCVSGESECPENMCGVKGKCLGRQDIFFKIHYLYSYTYFLLSGALEGIRQVKDNNECVQHCQKFDKCNWHTFDPDTKICYLTADCPALDKTCRNCVSSEKPCFDGEVSSGNSTGGA